MKRIVTITKTIIFVEEVQHSIEIPNDMALDEVADFLMDNEHLYDPFLDIKEGQLTHKENNYRYDVEEIVETKQHVWGGTL